jgi:hypothetical protein
LILTDEFRRIARDPATEPQQLQIVAHCRGQLEMCDECVWAGVVVARRIRGLGDVVERIATATGIKAAVEYVNGGPCGGCGQRQQEYNEAFPIGPRGR